MDYCEQWSRLIQVCGLQKLTQKLDLCLNLEMVDFSLFQIKLRTSVPAQQLLATNMIS